MSYRQILPLIPKEHRQFKVMDAYLIAGIYEHPALHIYYVKIPLSDLPNDLISVEDMKSIGI